MQSSTDFNKELFGCGVTHRVDRQDALQTAVIVRCPARSLTEFDQIEMSHHFSAFVHISIDQ